MVADMLNRWRACAAGCFVAGLLGAIAAPGEAEEMTVEFGPGSGEIRYVQFDDFNGAET